MPKNLQNPTMLNFEFIIKNAKIMFMYYLFRKLKCHKLHEDLTIKAAGQLHRSQNFQEFKVTHV